MQRHVLCVVILAVGASALMAADQPGYFGPLGRMGFQAEVTDDPEAEIAPMPGDFGGDQIQAAAAEMASGGPCNSCRAAADCALDAACNQCGDDCCNDRPRGLWGRFELLSWWVRGSQAPPLLTTSPAGTPSSSAGVLPGATVIFPTSDLNRDGRIGGRITLGYWLDPAETVGYEANYFALANQNHSYNTSGTAQTSGILARPFFNTSLPGEDSGLIAFPGLLSGTAGITTQVRLMGAEVNLRKAVMNCPGGRIDVLFGYRFLRFDDALIMNTNSTVLSGGLPVGTNFAVNDTFGTKNQFNGGQVGVMWQRNAGRWSIDATTKLAVGGISERVTVAGTTVVSVPNNTPVRETGGFLALGSNSGTYGRNVFALIPELNTNLRYQLTPVWRLNVGYTLLLVTNVLRASDQIDRNINPAQFPPPGAGSNTTPPNPNHNVFSTDLWVQGISLGAECRF